MLRMLSRVLAGLLLLAALPALAQPRAWLDRDRIGADETTTLNIESEGIARPDYAPLQRDFVISGRSSRSRLDGNGVRTLHAVALRPRRDGRLTIPALRVGNERTAPLSLQVTAEVARAPAQAGDDVFIESEADAADPYVQQAVGWVVRLYSAAPLISGQLEQPAPDGASLQQVGDDTRYAREIAGRRYEVVERRYLLIPERSGPLTVPGASFEGRGTGGFFDDLFGDRGGELSARSAPRALQVRPAPADAPQPWLPLRDLQLRYVATPSDLRAGSAGTVTIEVTADGATAAQMPELQLPPIHGVQVFADPAQADEVFREGRPRVKLTRRFSLVPSQAGRVTLPGMRIGWWDVQAGAARSARLPPMTWTVATGDAAGAPAALATPQVDGDAQPVADARGAHRGWVLATLLFAALWLFTLVWAFQHRARPAVAGVAPQRPAPGGISLAELKRALDVGELGDVAATLCVAATPPARDLDELATRLDDPAQREAIAALQRARWGDGDAVRARQLLRSAFARGPHWRAVPVPQPSPLPPLYPPA